MNFIEFYQCRFYRAQVLGAGEGLELNGGHHRQRYNGCVLGGNF